ncbi:MAG: hypothetical protein R2697_03985 [Ilumatobacteraceae bacterium]
MLRSRNRPATTTRSPRNRASDDDQLAQVLNSCHVWDEHGQVVADRRAGAPATVPIPMRRRLEELGRPVPTDFDG